MAAIDIAGLTVGDTLPDLHFGPITRAMLALYAGASGDHNPIHIDSDFAREAGLPDVFAQGMLSFGPLARAVTRWAGIERLREVGTRFNAMTQVHDLVTCRAAVVDRFERDGEQLARLTIIATAQDGRITLSGDATIAIG